MDKGFNYCVFYKEIKELWPSSDFIHGVTDGSKSSFAIHIPSLEIRPSVQTIIPLYLRRKVWLFLKLII